MPPCLERRESHNPRLSVSPGGEGRVRGGGQGHTALGVHPQCCSGLTKWGCFVLFFGVAVCYFPYIGQTQNTRMLLIALRRHLLLSEHEEGEKYKQIVSSGCHYLCTAGGIADAGEKCRCPAG